MLNTKEIILKKLFYRSNALVNRPSVLINVELTVYLFIIVQVEFNLKSKLQGWNLALKWFNVNPGHSFGREPYLSAEMQLVYFTAPADWASTS